MGKHATGAEALYKTPSANSFRARWDAAILIGRRRNGLDAARPIVRDVPGINRRSRHAAPYTQPLLPGQVYNENGEPEDEESFKRRGEEAKDSIAGKLLNCRRWYLREIADSPGKCAAFEILTELPIDWDKARRMEPQDHEPWRRPRMREPDMVLTAENGWLGTIVPYGPDKIGELQKAVDRHRAERGLPPADWSARVSAERSDATPQTLSLEGRGQGEGDSLARHPRVGGDPAQQDDAAPSGPPPSRTFGLNSQEFYDAVAKPGRHARVPTRSTERSDAGA